MTFTEFAKDRIILFDGAMGTQIQKVAIDDNVWAGKNGCNDFLNIAAPEIIAKIHYDYLASGSDIIVTNTFSATKNVLAEYGIADKVAEINRAAVDIAKKEAAKFQNKFVSLSVGPGTKLASLAQISYDDLYAQYCQQVEAGIDVDLFNIETCQDSLQMKAAVNACNDIAKKHNKKIPIILSFTIENNGNLLTGTDIETVATIFSAFDIFALGLNCSLGPDLMLEPFSKLVENFAGRLYLSPNAGMPITKNGETHYPMDAEKFTDIMKNIFEKYPLTLAGGCCGTNETHIAAMRKLIDTLPHRINKTVQKKGVATSLYSCTTLLQSPSCAFIGERANATGSKAFREVLLAHDIDAVIDIAKKQESEGAHFIDLSLAYTGRKELDDYIEIMPILNQRLLAPVVIDSTDKYVIEASLKRCSGKPIINSVNLEDGGKKLHEIFTIIKSHPACMVALTIDEDGMASSSEKKLEIAKRLYKLWVNDYGFDKEDLIIDPLTFSIGSGDDTLKSAAIETLEAIKLIKKELPGVKTVLGLSNVSFGLKAQSRPILNSVFLDEALMYGLDMAIAHSSKLTPINKLTLSDIEISRNLIYNKSNDAIDKFIAHFSDVVIEKKSYTNIPPIELLPLKIISGDKSGLEEIIEPILKQMKATDIINNILLPAMQKVGVEFGLGKILLPFVLQSAEAMKKAVSIIEPHIEKVDSKKADTVILATVKGDVHDIGKNLVDIILSNNGYKVINLGIKIDVHEMIDAAKKYHAVAIGMSGLLVKSTIIMKENLEAIKGKLDNIKIILGGAALTKKYVDTECANILPDKVFYCKDAFDGISAIEGSLPPAKDFTVSENIKPADIKNQKNTNNIKYYAAPKPPFFGVKIIENYSIDRMLKFLNKASLFRSGWGYKSGDTQMIKTAEEDYQKLISDLKSKNIIDAKVAYGYFKVKRDGDSITIFDDEKPVHKITFPRVKSSSLADYFSPTNYDILPMQIVTLGRKVLDYSKSKFDNDDYKDYLIAHGFFTEATDALAHAVHDDIRHELNIHDDKFSMDMILSDKYHGKRFSFGYPLIPDLAENKFLIDILNAGTIGIEINDVFQMEPEFTTSAIILHHKDAKYF